MVDIRKFNNDKEKIISLIKSSGPTYPNKIAREARIQPLFASAYLSELVSENILRLSSLKIGSSPLYFLSGQESMLENFIEHLNFKEKEAFNLLKQNRVLEDEKLHPAIRVALRSIKDFAVHLIINDKGQNKIFWRFFTFPEKETKSKIQELIEGIKIKAPIQEQRIAEQKQIIKEKQPEIKKDEKEEFQITLKEEKIKLKKPKSKSNEKIIDTKFRDQIRDYLTSKDIEILHEISFDKKEFISKIRIDIPLGKQEFYLISKNKKTITIEDFALALQKAQLEKMPALFLAPGKPNKAAQEYLKEWKNLIKFEQVKL